MPIPSGRRAYHRMTVLVATPPVSDADGNAAQTWAPATPPDWFCARDETPGPDLQTKTPEGTVVSQSAITITGPYRPDVTTQARLLDEAGRTLYIVGVSLPDEGRPRDLVCQCSLVGDTL